MSVKRSNLSWCSFNTLPSVTVGQIIKETQLLKKDGSIYNYLFIPFCNFGLIILCWLSNSHPRSPVTASKDHQNHDNKNANYHYCLPCFTCSSDWPSRVQSSASLIVLYALETRLVTRCRT